ncbi:unnamed protein product, partial [Allacma fusca]
MLQSWGAILKAMESHRYFGFFKWKFYTIVRLLLTALPIILYIQLNSYFEGSQSNPVLLQHLKVVNRSKRSGLIEPPNTEPIEIINLVPGRFWIYKRRATWHDADKFCE